MTGNRERVRIGRLLEHRLLTAPVDPSSLALFRILFGVMMAAGMLRFMALGWVSELYVLPTFHFTWELFPWVRPLPGALMHLLFAALALLACGVAAGFCYRASIVLFFLGFTYVELIDKATYLNHYYLVSLLAGLLIFLPAHRALSIDVWRRPALAARTIPSWTVNLLRFQIAVVYVFAGLAKINTDWLLEAQPMRIWLAARSDIPFAGQLFTQPWVAYAFSWFGAVYDLTIVFFLIWHRTRLAAYVTVIVFHAMTAVLFPIGMFPWIMIVATSIFFPPDWPRAWFKGGVTPAASEGFASHAMTRNGSRADRALRGDSDCAPASRILAGGSAGVDLPWIQLRVAGHAGREGRQHGVLRPRSIDREQLAGAAARLCHRPSGKDDGPGSVHGPGDGAPHRVGSPKARHGGCGNAG